MAKKLVKMTITYFTRLEVPGEGGGYHPEQGLPESEGETDPGYGVAEGSPEHQPARGGHRPTDPGHGVAEGSPEHQPARGGHRPVDPGHGVAEGHPEHGLPKPPTIVPPKPDQGLPSGGVSWPVDPSHGVEEGAPDQGLPPDAPPDAVILPPVAPEEPPQIALPIAPPPAGQPDQGLPERTKVGRLGVWPPNQVWQIVGWPLVKPGQPEPPPPQKGLRAHRAAQQPSQPTPQPKRMP